ncbi:hypothetical protein PoB_002330400 [Plakobranchus ocellatus]|uniref:Uncharacterized protein n=1 Tax=Plakobranchus ocellatus TaxID=259542 RepID=A0AAV3ZQX0_9GAST|nr:hypothetical protein PoB_002330400 [Plakobranchus ocellatus]
MDKIGTDGQRWPKLEQMDRNGHTWKRWTEMDKLGKDGQRWTKLEQMNRRRMRQDLEFFRALTENKSPKIYGGFGDTENSKDALRSTRGV